jgi:hypothetical protein
VIEAAKIVPGMVIGSEPTTARCSAYPILNFRESLQSLGLLRKFKGTLLLTRAGRAARRDRSCCGSTSPTG